MRLVFLKHWYLRSFFIFIAFKFRHTEFLYHFVKDTDTIDNIIPQEIQYLTAYDAFKRWLDDEFEMPDKLVALLVRFLEQNEGTLSKRARKKEFSNLEPEEAIEIEKTLKELFFKI